MDQRDVRKGMFKNIFNKILHERNINALRMYFNLIHETQVTDIFKAFI